MALAPDLYGERFHTREAGMQYIKGLTADAHRLCGRARTALDKLRSLLQVAGAWWLSKWPGRNVALDALSAFTGF